MNLSLDDELQALLVLSLFLDSWKMCGVFELFHSSGKVMMRVIRK